MYCKNCGSMIEDGAKFCTSCGAQTEVVTNQVPIEATPIDNIPVQPTVVGPRPPILKKGIISLIFSELPILNIIGLVFGNQAKRMFNTLPYPPNGSEKAGRILGKIGAIFSIITIVCYTIYFAGLIIGSIS